jgi:hypothetical protein
MPLPDATFLPSNKERLHLIPGGGSNSSTYATLETKMADKLLH